MTRSERMGFEGGGGGGGGGQIPDYAAMARALADLAGCAAARASGGDRQGDGTRLARLAEQLAACSADMEQELADHARRQSDWRLCLLNLEDDAVHADHAHSDAGGQVGTFDGPM